MGLNENEKGPVFFQDRRTLCNFCPRTWEGKTNISSCFHIPMLRWAIQTRLLKVTLWAMKFKKTISQQLCLSRTGLRPLNCGKAIEAKRETRLQSSPSLLDKKKTTPRSKLESHLPKHSPGRFYSLMRRNHNEPELQTQKDKHQGKFLYVIFFV